MARSQFTFYESFFKAVSRIKKAQDRAAAYDMICAYLLYGVQPDESVSLNVLSVFSELKPELDKERRMSVEGRRCSEYKEWRKAVFSRDDYTCQDCGARGVKINAHHIRSYAYCIDLRYSISNGITLCVPCHKKRHRKG